MKKVIEKLNFILKLVESNLSNKKIIELVYKECVDTIKEVEELQNRKCENCKYNKEQDNFMIFCDKTMCQDGSKMMWHSFTKEFSCKFWEPKQ